MLRKKIFREIKGNFGQFFTIFAMIFLAIMAYSGINAFSDGLKYSSVEFYEENNLQDLWLYGENFTDDDLEKIRALDNVADVERYLSMSGSVDVNNSEGSETENIPAELNFLDKEDDKKNISTLYLREGEEYSRDKDGVWIGYYFAKARGIQVGDELTFYVEGYRFNEVVRGIVSTPDHVYTVSDPTVIFQDAADFGWAYLSMKEFPGEYLYDEILKEDDIVEYLDSADDIKKAVDTYSAMGVDIESIKKQLDIDEDVDLETALEKASLIKDGRADISDKAEFIKALDPDFDLDECLVYPNAIVDVAGTAPNPYVKSKELDEFESKLKSVKNELYELEDISVSAITGRDVWPSYASLKSESEEGDTYSGMFTFLFVFIAGLSVVTTMSRFVKKQRVQIGTLKALGFRNNRVTIHYIAYGFWVSVIAAILGLVIGGPLLGQPFLNMELSMFDLPGAHRCILSKNYILAAIIVIVITMITYMSIKSILKESAAQTLRLEVPHIKIKAKEGGKGISAKLPFSVKWNMRDILRSKSRSIMAIVGVMGSTLLIVMAFGMQDSLNHYLEWEFDKIQAYNYKLTLSENVSDDRLNELFDTYGDATSQTVAIEYRDSEGNIVTSSITVNDSDGYLRVSDHDTTTYDINDGIPDNTYGDINKAGALFATEKLLKENGYSLGDTIKWRIMGEDDWNETEIVAAYRDPQSQQFSMTRAAFEGLGEDYICDTIYTNEDLSNLTDADIDGVSTISSIESLKEQMNVMLEMISSMIILLITISAILGFIIIYNMGILALSEKMYQFATLKVLGFRFKKLAFIYTQQNLWLTIVGIILGLPLGYEFTDCMFKYAIGDNYDFFANIDLSAYLIAIIGTLIIMFVTSIALSRNLKKIDMVASLKANE
ncbi:MacB-like core domain-containing protein [Pseudobutyrivibrio sp. ACV-2]|uniref:ABC transporter permease n=1 Tax=Pseudobutyrivibrio sp. ACV-2 TaxID=1520801 RepID=UPI00089D5B19|nr:ABC transporter permease [Pseudobutyrivibrio sp. ACV-2]SEA49504.1 MacB-like core domain-containing protein [Pseudobutyrivibrio sp. ACV-2]